MSIIHRAASGDDDPRSSTPRKTRILDEARRAFSLRGFAGASLRDIASEAAVSLTLVNHYFGSKEQLLRAVVVDQHARCRSRLSELRTHLAATARPASLPTLVGTWVRHEFALCASPQGADYLFCMTRLMNDLHLDAGLRDTLDCSEPIILHGLALAVPTAGPREIRAAFRLARGALHAALMDAVMSMEHGPHDTPPGTAGMTEAFVLAGLHAALHRPP
jgi:AcrR family transcriptional regulator